jgi:CBS domain-containing protein
VHGEPFPILGQYPPAVVLEEDAKMIDALIAFNVRGVRFGVVVDRERRLKGLMSIKRIVSFVTCTREWKWVCESYEGNIYKALSEVRVAEVMRPEPPHVVLGRFSVEDVIDIMAEYAIGAVPVVLEDGRVVGIISERHLTSIIHVVEKNIAVREVMTERPVVVGLEASLGEAAKVMGEKWIRHLPIVDDEGRPKHMLLAIDVVSYLSEDYVLSRLRKGYNQLVFDRVKARDIATEALVEVKPYEDLARALRRMRSRGLSGLVVVDEDGRAAGIVTERDIVVRLPKKLGLEAFYDSVRARIVFARPYF